MNNGIYAAVINDRALSTIFIDQENMEISRLNQKAQVNRQRAEREQANKRAAADKARKAEEARKQEIHRITARTIKQELCLAAATAVVYGGISAGQVSETWATPVLAVLLAVFCFKAGSFFGRIFRRRR